MQVTAKKTTPRWHLKSLSSEAHTEGPVHSSAEASTRVQARPLCISTSFNLVDGNNSLHSSLTACIVINTAIKCGNNNNNSRQRQIYFKYQSCQKIWQHIFIGFLSLSLELFICGNAKAELLCRNLCGIFENINILWETLEKKSRVFVAVVIQKRASNLKNNKLPPSRSATILEPDSRVQIPALPVCSRACACLCVWESC